MKENRYSRQILFPEIGEEGQKRLLESSVLILGCGALGTVIANNLARAGIGRLKLVDRDFVSLEDLQRQILFNEEDVRLRLPKALAARNVLQKVNSLLKVESLVLDVNPSNVEEIVKGVDLILDGTDNMETRFLLNIACIKQGTPWIYGAAVGSQGVTMNILPEETPCLCCLIPSLPLPGSLSTCDTLGVLNSIPSIIGSIEANEAIKILLHHPQVSRDLISIDVWKQEFSKVKVKKREDCPICVKKEFEYPKIQTISREVTLCGRNSLQISPERRIGISLNELAQRLSRITEVLTNEYLLAFQVEGCDLTVFADGRLIIKGDVTEAKARSLYAKYIGV